MNSAPTLRTERLVLRQLLAADAEALNAAMSDAMLMTWWSSAPHETLAQTEAYVARNAELRDGWRCWAITTDGAQALGWVVLIEKRAGVHEVGYILARTAWGKGLAREAVGMVVDHAFEVLRLRRVFADVDPDNAGSIRLLEALGFEREGCLRAEWETHIGVRDSLIFARLTTPDRLT
ncbi:MAG: GNAT family N-acetyltransferase [Sphingomonadaceae bacterium]